jgi:hypothetical protein
MCRMWPPNVGDRRNDFQDTRTPLTTGFAAMWWVTNQQTGVSALGLQRALGLGSYKTAWSWLHKLRRAMVRPSRDRQTETKALVAVAMQVECRRLGRIRLQRLSDAAAASLVPFVQGAAEPGSVIHTDGRLSYERLRVTGTSIRSRICTASGSRSPS